MYPNFMSSIFDLYCLKTRDVPYAHSVLIYLDRDTAVCVLDSTAAPTVAVVRTTNITGANFETRHGAL
jgi:hypothetical protein